jgi:hypothetical protein
MQVGVENVFALVSNGNMEEQVQANVDVGETFTTNVNIIEVELQKIIDMIEEQETIALKVHYWNKKMLNFILKLMEVTC